VIEALMFAALGFLVAALIALLIIPAVNARAERLARRRLEALFPLSITELTAEKDHLRAEFAVLQRRLERKAEEALATKHADLEELGRRAVRIEALEGEIAARDHRIGELDGDLERTRAQLVATEGELAATQQTLAISRETQAALDTAHRRTLDEFALTRGNLDTTAAALAETRTALAAAEERLAGRETAFTELDLRHTAILTEFDAKRITISDLETRLGTQTSRADELEHGFSQHKAELSQERQRVADLAQSLLAEQSRAAALGERVRALEAELAERQRLLAEAGAVAATPAETEKRAGAADDAAAPNPPETAELRRRIEEVADNILRVAETAVEEPPKRSRSVG
jgi:chromosome segregation ATPase